MAQATTRDVPSHGLRAFIVQTTDTGGRLADEVLAFVLAVRWVLDDFTRQVEPLHLSDGDYDLVAGSCGLTGLLGTVERMRRGLGSLAEAA